MNRSLPFQGCPCHGFKEDLTARAVLLYNDCVVFALVRFVPDCPKQKEKTYAWFKVEIQ